MMFRIPCIPNKESELLINNGVVAMAVRLKVRRRQRPARKGGSHRSRSFPVSHFHCGSGLGSSILIMLVIVVVCYPSLHPAQAFLQLVKPPFRNAHLPTMHQASPLRSTVSSSSCLPNEPNNRNWIVSERKMLKHPS